ncbi:MAG TPA: undecaprenyl-diphosphatase UppP [Candidatus Sulfopaludibacter sp.]|jgi:undecaprenyl-diphosphatase|nr:undecaprenyl-diphosphatase UppP [Candidatus Sulfopaludibacter sp.]
MPLLQIIVLAVVQGLTEFLPVSSTAHLYLTSWLLGWQTESLSFDVMLHLGTLLSILLYFFSDWLQLLAQGFGLRVGNDEELERNPMLLWLLALATIPVGVCGFLFNKQADGEWRTPWVMGTMLIAVGILMWVAENAGRKMRNLGSVNLPDALAVGFAQALAIIPGTSRSGITISAGLFRNLDRQAAARFSFLLSAPAIGGAVVKTLWDIHKQHMLKQMLTLDFAVGVTVSAVTGAIVIAWFLHYLRRSSLRPFVYYRIIFGIIVLALAFIRRPA